MKYADLAPRTGLPALSADIEQAVERTLATALTANEARVLRLRFGIGAPPRRVAEIARRLGVRITTVLRLERRAVRKLRAAAMAAVDEIEAPLAHRWLAPLAGGLAAGPPIEARKEWAARL